MNCFNTQNKQIGEFVFEKYFKMIINRDNFTDEDINTIYTEIDNIVNAPHLKSYEYLVLAVIMNYDKKIEMTHAKSEFSQKCVLEFAEWYNKNNKGNYMTVIDQLTQTVKDCILTKNSNIKNKIPKILYKYQPHSYKTKTNYLGGLVLFCLFCMACYYNYWIYDILHIGNIVDRISMLLLDNIDAEVLRRTLYCDYDYGYGSVYPCLIAN